MLSTFIAPMRRRLGASARSHRIAMVRVLGGRWLWASLNRDASTPEPVTSAAAVASGTWRIASVVSVGRSLH